MKNFVKPYKSCNFASKFIKYQETSTHICCFGVDLGGYLRPCRYAAAHSSGTTRRGF